MRCLHTDILLPLWRRPLLCLALVWAAGIFVAVRSSLPWPAWIVAALPLLIAWGLLQSSAPRAGSVALALSALCIAAGFSGWRLAPPAPGDQRYLPSGPIIVRGYPLAPPTLDADRWRAAMRVTGVRRGAGWEARRVDLLAVGRGEPPQPGATMRLQGEISSTVPPGDPFDFNLQGYLQQHGWRYRLRADEVTPLEDPAPSPPLARARAYCSRALAIRMPDPLHAQLLEGLVLGVYGSPLPPAVTEEFRRAGTIHLMVVSGSQVTLLGFLFLAPLLFRPLGWARTSYPRLRLLLLSLSLPMLGLYILLADRGPSVDRALVMVLLTALSLFVALSPLARQRSFRPDGLTLLAAAVLALLIGQPALLFSPALQLSVLAVLGLLTITPVLMRLWQRVPAPLILPLAATLGAQFATLPVLAWHFGVIPLLAPLTNLVAVPVVALLLPLGLLGLIFACAVPPLSMPVLAVCLPLLNLLLRVNHLAAGVEWGQWLYVLRSPWLVILYYGMLCLGVRALSKFLHSRAPGWEVPAGREPRMW